MEPEKEQTKWINKTIWKHTHRYREQANHCQRRGGWGMGIKK